MLSAVLCHHCFQNKNLELTKINFGHFHSTQKSINHQSVRNISWNHSEPPAFIAVFHDLNLGVSFESINQFNHFGTIEIHLHLESSTFLPTHCYKQASSISMSNNITRIEILGQRDINSKVAIDRAMPASLTNHLSSTEWEFFCNQVDNALAPLQDIKDRIRRMMRWASISAFVMFFVIAGGMVLSATLIQSVVVIPILSMLGFIFVLPGFIMFCRFRSAVTDVNAVFQDAQKVVEAESAKRSDVSFHMKAEQALAIYNSSSSGGARVSSQTYYHIEAQITGASIPMGGYAPVTANVVNSTFDTLNNGGKTAAERLHELEGVKHLITEKEYKDKKDAIIASL